MRQVLTIVAAAALMIGCVAAPSGPTCPALVPYTREAQERVRAALPTLPPDVARMVEDYGELRARCRALR